MDTEKSNILYVDDESNNLIPFAASLRRYYNVYTASSGAVGLELMRQIKMKVVIADQRMPEMTGVQFLEAIIPEYPRTIRIILTGFSDIEAIIKAINSGRVFRYLNKPWDENELKLNIDLGIRLYDLEEEKLHLIEKLQQENDHQKHIMRVFQKYVPAHVIQEALSTQNEETIIQGEYRIVSVLFIDIRNFTPLASKLGPNQTVEFLNTYFSLMADCISTHHGSVNKYLGDGILALFGAPVSYIDNPKNAVLCGLAMLGMVEELNAKYQEIIGHSVDIGIGIHSGEVIVGNVGTLDHIEYTVIGDTVNMASRIEGVTHDLPNSLLISETTYNAVKNDFVVEELGLHQLKGKSEKTALYRVLSTKDAK